MVQVGINGSVHELRLEPSSDVPKFLPSRSKKKRIIGIIFALKNH
jgi:hypothetical protein